MDEHHYLIFSPPSYILTLEGEGQGIAKKNNNSEIGSFVKLLKNKKFAGAQGYHFKCGIRRK